MAQVTVQSTVKTLDNTGYANVPVSIELVGTGGARVDGYVTATKDEIAGVKNLITDSSGTWSTTLYGNADITPANTVYRVVEQVPDDPTTYYVTVPNSGGPHKTGNILTDPPGALTPSALAAHIVDPSAHGGGGTGTGNPSGTVVAETSYGQASAVGTSLNFSRGDHSHGTPAGGVASTVTAMNAFDLTSVVGTAATFAREDHRHSTPATPAGGVTLGSTVAAETNYGLSSAAGSATTASKSDHTHGSPAKPIQTVTFQRLGTLSVGTGTTRWYANRAITLVSVRASVGTPSAGSAAVFDVNKNGTTIFSTQANRPSVAAGANTALSGTFSTSALAQGDYLTVDTDDPGSTPAASATVIIEYSVD